MKVLSIDHLFFLLPDDFEGGIEEALEELVEYHRLAKYVRKRIDDPPKEMSHEEARSYTWDRFLEAIEEDRKLVGAGSVHFYKNGEIVEIGALDAD